MKSKIEWTDAVWNPVIWSQKEGTPCENCYGCRAYGRFCNKELEQPLLWRNPRRILLTIDLFMQSVPEPIIGLVFGLMAEAYWHTFEVCTKYPQRMKEWSIAVCHYPKGKRNTLPKSGWPPNVWLGVSVEDQKTANERIPLLLQTPAAVRFVSAEPLLGPIDLLSKEITNCRGRCSHEHCTPFEIDWVICGGESGPGARPMHPDWARSLRDQCTAASVPFFFKQWGEWAPYDRGRNGEGLKPQDSPIGKYGKKNAGRMLDGRTWDEFPK